MQRLFRSLFYVFFLTLSVASTAHSAPIGQIGGACEDDGFRCNQGTCDRSAGAKGLCVSCGMPGEAACETTPGKFECNLAGMGFDAVEMPGGKRVCVSSQSKDCGEVGLKACLRDGQAYCYRGSAIAARNGAAVYCQSCGDYGQPCCTGTDLKCDYGTCQGGLCLPGTGKGANATRDQILDAIAECRFREARGHINALPAKAAFAAEVQATLEAATRREQDVARLYAQAKSSARSAKSFFDDGDYGNAALEFDKVLADLDRARQQTQCSRTMAVLDDALDMTLRNLARSNEQVALMIASDAIGLCNFSLAREELAGIANLTDERDRIQVRLDQAVSIENRVRAVYTEGQRLNRQGNDQLADDQMARAEASYGAAHAQFSNARQLTNCIDTRNIIDEALAAVGRNIMRVENAKSDKAKPAAPKQRSPTTGPSAMVWPKDKAGLVKAALAARDRWIAFACRSGGSGCAYDPRDVGNILAEFIGKSSGHKLEVWSQRLQFTDQCVMSGSKNARKCYDESLKRFSY
tara:strand:+ start:18380 stop:19945 length:1566 start_codon:yes stop_codon:yes gene_type:complete